MFHSNIQVFTEALKDEINRLKPGLLHECIQSEEKTYIEGCGKPYICKTCIKYMRKKKIPPMSAMNGLQLIETDEMIAKEGLKLTELEGALIAKSIIFQKIFQLPKSRWTALKDRLINIPINDDDIVNTLEQMPRTPKDAGLIGVALRRKKEYKNSHKHQLIDPSKLFKMLDKLKTYGNKYYQFYEDYSHYQERCKESDPTGYDVLFKDNVECDVKNMSDVAMELKDAVLDTLDSSDDSDDDDDNMAMKDNIEYETKDAVKKYQFEYNKSLCMANKYPEISANDSETVSVAPGEGKIPKDIMNDEDWDIKAFPHLNNPDGTNGKDQERKVQLTEQNYFIQRICNKEKRFSNSPAYMYAAIGYLEKKQLQRNINLANTRGKEVMNEVGEKAYKLEDGYRVLEDIKNTPRYWKTAKYEMIAKLDNLGPFHLFFTLSCADMRWNENFASILHDKGFDIKYKVAKDDEDNWDTIVTAKKKNDKEYKPIKQFIEEDVEESLHELIRGNVLTATRYFQQRVKNFMSKVAMGQNNPMHVKNYTYKVEFQDRGAGHVHGTLWLRLDKIENLIRDENGHLREKNALDFNELALFTGLTTAFKKFRHNEKLTETEETAVRNFIE